MIAELGLVENYLKVANLQADTALKKRRRDCRRVRDDLAPSSVMKLFRLLPQLRRVGFSHRMRVKEKSQ